MPRLFISGQAGQPAALLSYTPQAVAPGAGPGAAAGALSSALPSPVFSWVSGPVAVSATGLVTTTMTAPASGSIVARVKVADAANTLDVEAVIDIPVSGARAKLFAYKNPPIGGDTTLADYGAWLGRIPDGALSFMANIGPANAGDNHPGVPTDWSVINPNQYDNINSFNYYYTAVWQSYTGQLLMSLRMLADNGTLALGAAGAYDTIAQFYGQSLVNRSMAGASTLLRLMWEENGNWDPWRAAADPTNYVAYYQRVVTQMRAQTGFGCSFVWCPNSGYLTGAGEQSDPTVSYPGDAYVDYIGIDAYGLYNGAYANIASSGWGLTECAAFAALHGKPMAICEWGTTVDDANFITDVAGFIDTASNNVALYCYWDSTAALDCRLSPSTPGGASAKPNAAAAFLSAFG